MYQAESLNHLEGLDFCCEAFPVAVLFATFGIFGVGIPSPLGYRRHLADYVLVWAGGHGDDMGKSPHLVLTPVELNSMHKHLTVSHCRLALPTLFSPMSQAEQSE